MILYCEVDFEVPIILGRPFLSSGHVVVAMEKVHIMFRIINEETTFDICRSKKEGGEVESLSAISYRVNSVSEVNIEERLGVEYVGAVMMNYESDGIEDFDELVDALKIFGYWSKPKRFDVNINNHESPPSKSSTEEAPKFELKSLPPHLKYVFLGMNETLLVIVVTHINRKQVECLVAVLKRYK